MIKFYFKACDTIEAVWYSQVIDRTDAWMQKHSQVSDFFAWDEPDEDDEDTKKAPAAATAGAENFVNNNVYPGIVSHRLGLRKVAR